MPRFSYMIEQLTAAKSLRPEHALTLYHLIVKGSLGEKLPSYGDLNMQ